MVKRKKKRTGIRIREVPNTGFIIQGICKKKKKSMINMLKDLKDIMDSMCEKMRDFIRVGNYKREQNGSAINKKNNIRSD